MIQSGAQKAQGGLPGPKREGVGFLIKPPCPSADRARALPVSSAFLHQFLLAAKKRFVFVSETAKAISSGDFRLSFFKLAKSSAKTLPPCQVKRAR